MAAKRRHQTTSAPENGRTKQTLPSSGKAKTAKRKEREMEVPLAEDRRAVQTRSKAYVALTAALAVLAGLLHRQHISNMFESDRHFSHLSTLERELSFRTEMGLYYSYFKTMVEAPTFMSGLDAIMYDNRTEYPANINTLKRFNLYPEVILGLAYRTYSYITNAMDITTKTCWRVERGDNLTPVLSCVGLGEMPYFYVESVFLLNGINMAVFFLFGTFISGSIFGGCLAVTSFFFNHGECTRVQWTPPLRESFAYPFLVMEMFIVTYILRIPRPNYKHSILLAVATVCFMLPWQFAQFALMTQTVAIFGTYVLMFIGSSKLKVLLAGQALGLAISYLCLFGNEMLLTSFFAACLLTVTVIVYLEPVIEKIRFRFLIWVVQGILLIVGTVGIKIGSARFLGIADDKHIGDILKSKFTSYKNFHTMLYTCAAEFDFMEKETPWRVLKTLLAPCALIAVVVTSFQLIQKVHPELLPPALRLKTAAPSCSKKLVHRELRSARKEPKTKQVDSNGNHGNGLHSYHSKSETNGSSVHTLHADGSTECVSEKGVDIRYRSKPDAELVYLFAQLVAFTIMAVLIMRLKLFWTPLMCLSTALLARPQTFRSLGFWSPRNRQFGHIAVLGLVLAGMSVQGYANLKQQWSIQGEYSNPTMEYMVEWINKNTSPNAVFGGPMPTMATIKLCTNRPIVNHPHYEDADLRARTKKVYTMYSRKPPQEVWRNLIELGVDYVILEETWCIRRARPGCAMAEIWDLEDAANRHVTVPTCAKIHKNPGPYFTSVYRNQMYDILKLTRILAEDKPTSKGSSKTKATNKNPPRR